MKFISVAKNAFEFEHLVAPTVGDFVGKTIYYLTGTKQFFWRRVQLSRKDEPGVVMAHLNGSLCAFMRHEDPATELQQVMEMMESGMPKILEAENGTIDERISDASTMEKQPELFADGSASQAGWGEIQGENAKGPSLV